MRQQGLLTRGALQIRPGHPGSAAIMPPFGLFRLRRKPHAGWGLAAKALHSAAVRATAVSSRQQQQVVCEHLSFNVRGLQAAVVLQQRLELARVGGAVCAGRSAPQHPGSPSGGPSSAFSPRFTPKSGRHQGVRGASVAPRSSRAAFVAHSSARLRSPVARSRGGSGAKGVARGARLSGRRASSSLCTGGLRSRFEIRWLAAHAGPVNNCLHRPRFARR